MGRARGVKLNVFGTGLGSRDVMFNVAERHCSGAMERDIRHGRHWPGDTECDMRRSDS